MDRCEHLMEFSHRNWTTYNQEKEPMLDAPYDILGPDPMTQITDTFDPSPITRIIESVLNKSKPDAVTLIAEDSAIPTSQARTESLQSQKTQLYQPLRLASCQILTIRIT